MPTVQAIITSAYNKCGIITPISAELTTGINELNYMLNSWSIEGLLVASLTEENFALTIGQSAYTMGASANFDTVRPNAIDNAYLRDGSSDYELDIRALEDYKDIVLKSTSGRPQILYFLPSYPLAKLYFDYQPDKAYVLYIDSWKPITNVSSLSATFNIPPEYELAIIHNLAIHLSSNILLTLGQAVYAIAGDSKERLKLLHAAQSSVPIARFDNVIVNRNRTRFDINKGE